MKVLVTGHHGYLGSVLTPVLAAAGHEVVGLDIYLYDGCDLTGEAGEVRAPSLDVRDVTPSEFEGLNAVVHLAALSNDPLGDLDPILTHEINLRATARLASMARAAGVERFLLASSCSIYGATTDGSPVDERAPAAPLTAYAESKVRAEEAIMALVDDAFAPISMRNATAFGVSDRLRLDLVLNNLSAWAFATGTVRILSDGTPWRPLVHVEDIARATVAILEAPTELVRGEAFNVGSDDANYQVRDLAEIVRRGVAGCDVEIAGNADSDPRSYRVSFAKFSRAFPAFRFGWDAERGISELLSAYRTIGLTAAELDGSRFFRVRRLRGLIETGVLDSDLRWQETA